MPDAWQEIRVEEAGTVVTGSTPSTTDRSNYGGSVPFVTPVNLDGSRWVDSCVSTLSEKGSKLARLLPPETVLVACIGILGKVGQVHETTATNQQINAIIPGQDVSSHYLYYAAHLLERQMKRVAGLQVLPIVNKSQFSLLTVPKPPLPEQRAIATILDTLDSAIRQTEQVITKLKLIKQGLLHDLLTRGIDENGELRLPPEEAPGLYKESPLGMVPREWEVHQLREYYKGPSKNGLYKPSTFHGRGPLMVQMGGMFRGGDVDFSGASRVEVSPLELDTYGLRIGDLLFARRSLVLEGAGKCALVRALPEASTFESSIVRVRVDPNRLSPHFASLFLGGPESYLDRRRFIRQVAVSGVSGGDISQFLMVKPPVDEQHLIVDGVSQFQRRVDQELVQVEKLRTLKSGLMDDLLSGRVRVRMEGSTQ